MGGMRSRRFLSHVDAIRFEGDLDHSWKHWQASAAMPTMTDMIPEVVFYEGPESAAPLDGALLREMFAGLLDRGYAVDRVVVEEGGREGDAHEWSPEGGRPVLVLGDFGDAVGFSARWADVDGIERRNIGGRNVEELLALVEETRGDARLNTPGAKGGWKPWFPVIDYDRCTNCLQCLTFCLFDVYSVDAEKQITVQNNDKCKTNCPACSRVCPEVAIMFPKYQGGPINGDAVSEADLGREKMKVDISSLLGGDIYASLRDRSERAKSRFSAERDADKALAERKRCLKKLQAEGMVPADVLASIDLASLPTPEEIRRKTEAVEQLLDEGDEEA